MLVEDLIVGRNRIPGFGTRFLIVRYAKAVPSEGFTFTRKQIAAKRAGGVILARKATFFQRRPQAGFSGSVRKRKSRAHACISRDSLRCSENVRLSGG